MLTTREKTIATLHELRQELGTIDRPLTLPELLNLTSRLRLPANEWQPDLEFDPQHFCYRTIYESPHFEVNLIGWRSQQWSSVHDHRGSNCCVLVLDGILTNNNYHLDPQLGLKETTHEQLRPGEIVTRKDRQIHRCGNGQPSTTDLATLHLYSPPLRPLSERQYAGGTG